GWWGGGWGGWRGGGEGGRGRDEAMGVEAAGAFAIVVECVPEAVAARITEAVKIPTIGIGAGPQCDGQILVTPDVLGMFEELKPRFAKRYADVGAEIRSAVQAYCRGVREGAFPGPEAG